MTVTLSPQFGTISQRVGDSAISGGPGIIDRCIGLTGKGTIVTYTPAKGFVGEDRVRYTVVFVSTNGSSTTRDFNIRIVVHTQATPEANGWTKAR